MSDTQQQMNVEENREAYIAMGNADMCNLTLTDAHIDINTELYPGSSGLLPHAEMEVQCDCEEWVGGFYVAGQVFGDGPIVRECSNCGKQWTIGALEVDE